MTVANLALSLKEKGVWKAKDLVLGLISNFKKREALRLTKNDLKQALAETESVFEPAHVPKSILIDGKEVPLPEDLRDTYNHLLLDKQGHRLTGRMLLADLVGGIGLSSPAPVYPALKARQDTLRFGLVPCFAAAAFVGAWLGVAGAAVYALHAHMIGNDIRLTNLFKSGGFGFKNGIIDTVKNMLGVGMGVMLPLAALWLSSDAPTWFKLGLWPWLPVMGSFLAPAARNMAERFMSLIQQDYHFQRNSPVSRGYQFEIEKAYEARYQQGASALRDKSPVMDFNFKATGYMARLGCLHSPDAGKSMKLSLDNLMPGLFGWGEPGTGKTSGLLRPIMLAWLQAKEGGSVTFDDKGDLQREFVKAIANYRFIAPEDFAVDANRVIPASPFNPIEGMNADVVADLLPQAMAGDDAKSDEWSSGTRDLVANLGIILEFCQKLKPDVRVKYKWHLANLFKIISNEIYMWNAIRDLSNDATGGGNDFIKKHKHLMVAVQWVLGYYTTLADRTKSSLLMNLRGWANTLESNRAMSKWMNTEHGVMIEDALYGDHIGIYCPKARYGEAGPVVEKLCRWRLYRAIKARGSEWKHMPADSKGRKHRYVMMLWDEMALGVGNGKQESDIIPVARSLGLAIVAAAQSINQFFQRMGTDSTRAMLVNFPHMVCYRSDKETLDYMQSRLGHIAKIVPAEGSDVPVGIDYLGSLNAIAQSANPAITTLYDQEALENTSVSVSISDNNGMDPAGFAMKALPFNWGNNTVGKNVSSSLSYKHISPELAQMRFINGGKVTLKDKPLWDVEESGRLLNVPFHCIVQIQRGNVKRYDLCYTKPMFDFSFDADASNDDEKQQAA